METVAVLGKGRFSRIRCVKTSNGDYLACKEYNRAKAITEGYVNRILQEKEILQNLSCVYIMGYSHTSKDDENLYLYVEPALGGGLHLHIQQTNGFPITLCKFYISQVIVAMEYLALKGVVHRDLKANNILLTSQGHIKVCDFGSAKQLVSIDQATTITAGGPALCPKAYTMIGSAHIMAPEMICKSSMHLTSFIGYDFTVDWWAIGVLLLEMIYGSIPNAEQLESLQSVSSDEIFSSMESSRNFWSLCGHTPEDLISQFHKPLAGLSDSVESPPASLLEELSSLMDLLQRLLCLSLSSRWSIWTIDQILSHSFFSEVRWEDVRAGRCPAIDIDRRLGFLEVIEASDARKEEEVLSSTDQALFEGF